jgi:hypothetical protein
VRLEGLGKFIGLIGSRTRDPPLYSFKIKKVALSMSVKWAALFACVVAQAHSASQWRDVPNSDQEQGHGVQRRSVLLPESAKQCSSRELQLLSVEWETFGRSLVPIASLCCSVTERG